MGGISIWQLVIIAVIVVLLFGTNKLRTVGSDLGAAIKGFKKAVGDGDEKAGSELDAEFSSRTLAEKKPSNDLKREEIKNDHKQG